MVAAGVSAGAYLAAGQPMKAAKAAIGLIPGGGAVAKGVVAAKKAKRLAGAVKEGYRFVKSVRVPAVNKDGIVFKVTYTNGRTGGKKFLKLDKPDKMRHYYHWTKGRVTGSGNERATGGHRRIWGKKVG